MPQVVESEEAPESFRQSSLQVERSLINSCTAFQYHRSLHRVVLSIYLYTVLPHTLSFVYSRICQSRTLTAAPESQRFADSQKEDQERQLAAVQQVHRPSVASPRFFTA